MIQPELQPILQSIFSRLNALEDAKAKTLTDEALITFYEDRLEAGRKREETLIKTVEALLRKAQEK